MCPEITIGSFVMQTEKLVHLLCIVVMLIACILTRKKYNFTTKRALIIFVYMMFLSEPEQRLMGEIQNLLIQLVSNGELIQDNAQRILGTFFFRPLLIMLIAKFLGEKTRKILDYIAPITFIQFAIGKLACLVNGCCHGIPYENGIFNDKLSCNVFPVQLYESLSTLVVVIILFALALSKIKFRKGSIFPLGVILYSLTRYFWENYRYYDNQWESDFMLGMNFWQFWSVIAIIMSVIWLLVLYLNPKYAECSFEADECSPLCKIEEKIKESFNKIKPQNKTIVHHNKNKKRYQKKNH